MASATTKLWPWWNGHLNSAGGVIARTCSAALIAGRDVGSSCSRQMAATVSRGWCRRAWQGAALVQLQLDPIAMNLVQLERWCARSYGSAVRRLVRRCGGSSSCAAAHAASYSRAAIRSAVRRSLVNLVQLERWCARSCGGAVRQVMRRCSATGRAAAQCKGPYDGVAARPAVRRLV